MLEAKCHGATAVVRSRLQAVHGLLLSVSAALPQLQLGTKPLHAVYEASFCIGPFDGAQGTPASQTNLSQAFQECALVSDQPSRHHHC